MRSLPVRRFAAALGVVAACVSAASCGSRDAPFERGFGSPLEGGVLTEACLGDLDCGPPDLCAPKKCVDGACVDLPPVECDDADACTEDGCTPETGKCEHRALSLDLDGDGHRGPRPGYAPGSPGSCGDDCNDTSAAAKPGGVEVCDGVDNDCNGVIDDGASYVPASGAPLLLAPGARQSGVGGIVFGASEFAVFLGAEEQNWETTFAAFDVTGALTVPAKKVNHVNTDSLAGPVVWNGSAFATAWEDRRDGDYEIYFNRFDGAGNKLGADVRVTNAPGFSLRPDLLWDGAEFVIVWPDWRDDPTVGRIYGQRLGPDGAKVGGNVPLTPPEIDADEPHIAQGASGFGLVTNEKRDGLRELVFRAVSSDLSAVGPRAVVGGDGAASSAVVWSGDRYVVAWDTLRVTPGPTIQGAALGGDGSVLLAERSLTAGAPYARTESLVPLGDRLLLTWAEESSGSYDLFTKTIGLDLSEIAPRLQLTAGASDSLNPAVALGPAGTAGVVFEDNRGGPLQVYAMRLDCAAGTGPGSGASPGR